MEGEKGVKREEWHRDHPIVPGNFILKKKNGNENILELFYGYEIFFISHAVYTESFIILIKISSRVQFNAIIYTRRL